MNRLFLISLIVIPMLFAFPSSAQAGTGSAPSGSVHSNGTTVTTWTESQPIQAQSVNPYPYFLAFLILGSLMGFVIHSIYSDIHREKNHGATEP
ncbi:MAG: hypothetical protein KGN01_06845 [Patescibacteria group bacterium]|nr:hypothetical protein [Patescibacteria group bacterium]